MKNFIYLFIAGTLLYGCSAGQKSTKIEDESLFSIKNVAGMYSGVLPCADCEGIKTQIIVDEQGGYKITRDYLGKHGGRFSSVGTVNIDPSSGLLTLTDKEGSVEALFLIEEESLEMLTTSGEKIEGNLADMYILKRAPEYDLIVFDPGFEYWLKSNVKSIDHYSNGYLQSYNSRYVQEWNRRFLSGDKRFESYIDYDSRKNYNKDFNFKLFMYFKYFEERNRVKLL